MLNWPSFPMFRRVSVAGAALFLTGFIVPVFLPDLSSVAVAVADDDDGGGDDGGGRGGGGRGGSDGGQRFRGPQTFMDYLDSKQTPKRARNSKLRKKNARPRVAVATPLHEPRRLVVLGLDDASISRLVASGFVVDERASISIVSGELVRLEIPDRMAMDTAREHVRREVPDAVVDFNHYYNPESTPATACAGRECSLVRNLIGWNHTDMTRGRCAQPARIGLIDTAINPDHEALREARIETVRLSSSALPQSGKQHGTAVAALLVGAKSSHAPGLLPGAELIAVDAFHASQSDANRASAYDLVRAVDLLVGEQVRIVNMSLSGPHNLPLEKVVGEAVKRKITMVAAAGNNGPHAKPVYPAAFANVVAVTAVDRNGNPYRRAVRGEHIDLAAPGVGVWTAASISGTRQKTGTSYAAPFVTAAAAVLKSARPDLDSRQVVEELQKQAKDLGDPGHDPVFGWGLLDTRRLCEI